MKKVLIKDEVEFHEWQRQAVKWVDDAGQRAVSAMKPPVQYPVIIIWHFVEQHVEAARGVLFDKFYHKFIYLVDFPVKNLKRGTYAYQVFQTNDVSEI